MEHNLLTSASQNGCEGKLRTEESVRDRSNLWASESFERVNFGQFWLLGGATALQSTVLIFEGLWYVGRTIPFTILGPVRSLLIVFSDSFFP